MNGDNPLTKSQNLNLSIAFFIFGFVYLLIVLLIISMYFFFPQWKLNRTLGQKILGLKIQNQLGGKNISFKQTFFRTLPLQAAIIISFLGHWMQYIALLIILVDSGWYFYRPGKQTLHDYLSQTTVVKI